MLYDICEEECQCVLVIFTQIYSFNLQHEHNTDNKHLVVGNLVSIIPIITEETTLYWTSLADEAYLKSGAIFV